MSSLIIEFGRCGFGLHGGSVPEVRIGLFRFAWFRGSILSQLDFFSTALQAAYDKIR